MLSKIHFLAHFPLTIHSFIVEQYQSSMKYLAQILAGVIALLCTILSLIFWQPLTTTPTDVLYVTIESPEESTVAITSIQKIGGARISIENNAAFAVTVHVPSNLSPVTARNTTIDAITQPPVSASQATFTLPAYTGVTVEGSIQYDSLRIYNKNEIPLLVYFSRIDLRNEDVLHDSKLIVEKRGELW